MEDSREVNELIRKYNELKSELDDLQLLYENTLEHGTSLENDLVEQNKAMETLQNKMKKYLSPQLYQALVGGTAASTQTHVRKRLTMYFSDIVGFSDLTDSIEPELLSDILNSYLTRMSEIALKHGGTIDKFIGDAMLVFFGDPEFIDDVTHAQRCVAMALEMREDLYLMREEWRLKGINRVLKVRAGINTGYCTVGNFGSEHRMDYTIIGGQVNMASRLQSSAQPDTIYMSSATYSLVENIVDTAYIGPIQVKGIHAPVEVYELRGLKQRSDDDDVSELLDLKDGGMSLKAIELDFQNASGAELKVLRKALGKALVHLTARERQNDSST